MHELDSGSAMVCSPRSRGPYDPAVTSVRIHPQFVGPADCANGGWSAWLLATQIGEPVTVALRSPIPLGVDLTITDVDGSWQLVDTTIATRPTTVLSASRWTPNFPATDAISIDDARAARTRFPYTAEEHPASQCFSCGVGDDSMRTHAGPLLDGRVATDWTVPTWAVLGQEQTAEGALWAALDCTSAWFVCGGGDERRAAFTVQFACEVLAPLAVDVTYALVGWGGDVDRGWDGRKREAASAAFDPDGNCVARSVSLWVSVDKLS